MSDLKPLDGTAVVLHLVEAARRWATVAPAAGDCAEAHTLAAWVRTLDDWVTGARPEKITAPQWAPRRWRELVAGDRVAMGGVEAEVESAMLTPWHVQPPAGDPDSWEYRQALYNPTPLEYQKMAIRLKGWASYQMPADGEVETLRGPAGQAVDEAAALGALDPEQVLGSWAGQAAETLAAAGLWRESTEEI